MTKKQLEKEIEDLKKENGFYFEIIQKLIKDYINIKPIPKGKIKERIVVINNIVSKKNLNITSDILMFLGSCDFKNGDITMERKNK